uniref:Uncharacterized protein n=1 Tax=Anguilla anguilla TaxID=7936 RepID=A0A0E9SI50_ANGAN
MYIFLERCCLFNDWPGFMASLYCCIGYISIDRY